MAFVTSNYLVLPTVGYCMLGVVVGLTVLFLSDVVDDRPMDDRNFSACALNLIGIAILFLSLLGMLLYVTLFLSLAIPQFNSRD